LNTGILAGLRPDVVGWRTFAPQNPPILASFAVGGGATQPVLGASQIVAHYFHDRQVGKVFYQGYIQFSSDATYGSGDNLWGVRLPVPALRVLGSADLPIGSGMAWQGTVSNRNMPLRATLMDPFPGGMTGGNNTQEDKYMQFFLPHLLATGTGSIGSGATSTTITHGLGGTPVEYDINIRPTSNATNNVGYWYITNCTSTQFTVNVQTQPGTNAFNFSWKARMEPNGVNVLDLLVNSARPFGGGWAGGYVLGWSVEYQARR
jgi:hypothetical protein